MNFLAHIYLSGESDDIRLGNFIGDYVKGKEHSNYSPDVQRGILLHRKIDSFTDNHPIVRTHKTLFYNKFHKYAGVVTDIIYDHYLATNWHMFSDILLENYIQNVYEWLIQNVEKMPSDMHRMVPSMVKNDWLNAYKTIEGIGSVLIGMSKGTSLPAEYDFALLILRKHYQEIKHGFFDYFPQLIEYVEKQFDENQ